MTAILGISAYYHDSAAALVVDGQVVAAAQQERFSRQKHDESFPTDAIEYCLSEGGIEPSQLDYVGFYDKPFLKFERLLETYFAYAPRGFRPFLKAMPVWLRQKLHIRREMNRGLKNFGKGFVFTEHHESHAASAFFPSPFEEAAIITLDGVGEWATASYGTGSGNRIKLTRKLNFPHSLGLLYSAFTYFTGFQVNSGEYKLMGLAPYGEPKYVDQILDRLIDLKEDGSLWMDMSYFNYCQGLTMTSKKFDGLFGGAPRQPETPITQREMDIAASIQKVTEEIMLRMARHVHAETGQKNLCLAGGVALNCVANGRILREGPFEDIWIQPAAGDAGGALGVALFIWYQLLKNSRTPNPQDDQLGSLLGPSFSDAEVKEFLKEEASYTYIGNDTELCDHVADLIAEGKVVGWFQGRMEFGPRALGSRSLLGDPRNPEMQTVMNLKVKFREGFRPFAPAVLRERADEYFDMKAQQESPYMLLVAPVREQKRRQPSQEEAQATGIDKLKSVRSEIPAVTHVDYSARMQTVDPDRHGLYYRVIDSFYRKTGCPVVVNTSFNLGWDPIVCTPEDAYRTFMSSEIDALCMGHYVLIKKKQRASVEAVVAAEGPDPVLSELWCSPNSGGELVRQEGQLVCKESGQTFPVEDGIPLLFWPHEASEEQANVTELVKSFYEETPFPNYDEHETVRSLIEKSRRGQYARMLDGAIPYGSTVLEVGCGTGQLTNFLGISSRRAIGADLCLNSLRLAEGFRRQQGLSRVRFVQMNLFRPCFKPEQFDVVICNGVLLTTKDPYAGFRSIEALVRPGGHIVVGLYNTYGRLMTDMRRMVFRITGGRGKWIDPYLRSQDMSPEKQRAWFADQYLHPHETKQTIGEVLRWFDGCGLEFVRGIPSVTAGTSGRPNGGLFDRSERGTKLDHFVVQAKHFFTGSREGGFFIMIAQKPRQATSVGAQQKG